VEELNRSTRWILSKYMPRRYNVLTSAAVKSEGGSVLGGIDKEDAIVDVEREQKGFPECDLRCAPT
jgi:hypothetical protein